VIGFIVYTKYTSEPSASSDLAKMDVSELEWIDAIVSPDQKKTLAIYSRGGIFGISEHIYIGELIDLKKLKRRNIFLIGGFSYDISWVDPNHININGKIISTKDTYDIRYD